MLIFVNAPILTKTLLNLVAVLSILLVFYGIWWHPFGQQKPLWSEKTKWIRDGKEVILLDQAQISILQKIEKWEEGKGSEQLLAAAYRVPGLVWLTGRRIPFSPGIWEKEQLKIFFDTKPKAMIYYNLEDLPENWNFKQRLDLGHYQGNSLELVWD
jgi:hypothetical protein